MSICNVFDFCYFLNAKYFGAINPQTNHNNRDRTMIGIKQKYQDLFFQTEQRVNKKKSGFRTAQKLMGVAFLLFPLLTLL